jgi:hypothetical protein
MDFAPINDAIDPQQELEVDQINFFSQPEAFDLSESGSHEIYEEDSSKPFVGVSFKKCYKKCVHFSIYPR